MMTTTEVKAKAGRLPTLDILRGLASLAVVVHHCLLVDPRSNSTEPGNLSDSLYGLISVLVGQPGPVVIFFVLSGFVLTRAIDYSRPGIAKFIISRCVRLLLPIWAIVGLALIFYQFVAERNFTVGASDWVNAHTAPTTARDVVRHLLPLLPGQFWIVSPLWTMRWELVFSLFLPILAILLRKSSTFSSLLIPAGTIVAFSGSLTDNGALLWLPIFLIGSGLASAHERVQRVFGELRFSIKCFSSLVALAFLWLPGFLGLSWPLHLFGATLSASILVCLGSVWQPRPSRVTKCLHWLGSRSFSLYIVHEIVLFGVLAILGYTTPIRILILPVITISLIVAELFYRAAERPALKLSRLLSRDRARPHLYSNSSR